MDRGRPYPASFLPGAARGQESHGGENGKSRSGTFYSFKWIDKVGTYTLISREFHFFRIFSWFFVMAITIKSKPYFIGNYFEIDNYS